MTSYSLQVQVCRGPHTQMKDNWYGLNWILPRNSFPSRFYVEVIGRVLISKEVKYHLHFERETT